MCGVVVDGFDHREGVEMILLCVERLRGRGGRRVANAYAVEDEPLVDGLCRMRHEDSAAKVCFREDVREGSCVVDVETGKALLARQGVILKARKVAYWLMRRTSTVLRSKSS